MIDFDKELQAILADDPLGLLEMKPQTANAVTADDRLIAAFEEINAFVEMHGHEPTVSRDIQERKLYSRLQGLREDGEKARELLPLDRFALLHSEYLSIERVMDEDPLGLLDTSDNIFDLKHVTAGQRASAELIAKRKPCKNFALHEADFIQVQQELKTGSRKIIAFRQQSLEQLVEGAYYILNGILLKLVSVAFSTERLRKDGRTYCVFENGTESKMLYRSLLKALYKDGGVVTESAVATQTYFSTQFGGITEEDSVTGYVYVLRSLSPNPAIRDLAHLYKIGFSSQRAQQRIKNAAQEPTYLMADVEVISEYQTYNLNPQKLELLLHRFFAEACLNLDVFDQAGQRHTPREWFVVPLAVIDQAIRLLLAEQILDYAYDLERQQLVRRK
ncbi:MAG: hypothetical protein BWK73_43670 [Thiothrix lacustris]|uniref:Bacteriophage T5 Orf172 DNA-binding domain-containing protein n=1 Tax=Thiothrix lacustris TaxID=525917 RepID=A0A1Y1QC29_9GAMM|nr:MAG: hypothetical protein BWK73_43670 [Thiothrix lacustris]